MSTTTKEFYSNDIVYRFDKKKRINFGVVVDSWEGSTDSDDSSPLLKGQVRVWWFNSSRETVSKQSKIRLLSRSIIPGDIVCRSNGNNLRKGYCRESKQYATVQIVGTDKIIEKVPSNRLPTLAHYENNDAVCLGNKFGRIQNVDEKITMHAKCGSTVTIFASLNHEIEDYWLTRRHRGYYEHFYAGQEVTCTPNNLIQPVWLNRTKVMKASMQKRQRFTIQSVEPTDIEVAWYDNDSMSNVNMSNIKKDDIKNLKVVEPVEKAHLVDLAERRMLKLSSSDVLLKKKDWVKKQWSLYQPEYFKNVNSKVANPNTHHKKKGSKSKIRRPSLVSSISRESAPEENDEGWWTDEVEEEISENASVSSNMSGGPLKTRHFPPKSKELVPGSTLAVEVLCMDSKATVVWQDGTEERDIPTTQLNYSISLDDHEFYPGEWVVEEGKSETLYGVVQSVDHTERTAKVKWFTRIGQEDTHAVTSEKSVYDLKKHSKFIFRPGSIVKKVPVEPEKLGYVIDSYPEGSVGVQWIDGTIESCSPYSIELIPETIEYEISLEDNDSVQVISWETESIESVAGDMTDETTLQNMAARLDFVRGRVIYLKEVFGMHTIEENFSHLKELLTVYDNCSYLDKLLETSFFSLKSKHFQILLSQVKEKAKSFGVELRGRLFSNTESMCHTFKSKNPEKENINKLVKLEHKIQTQIGNTKESEESTAPQTPETELSTPLQGNICIELLSMIKVRMDLAYAEIISRIGSPQAFSVMTNASEKAATPSTVTPMPSMPVTPDESFCIFSSPKLDKSVITKYENEPYVIIEEVPTSHHFASTKFEPWDKAKFYRAVQKEYKLLKESLPPGVWVRSYQNRLDLLSVLIVGPARTPYEDGLFMFDVQLSPDYPRSPPVVHYVSYSSERLNPNLYVEGKVCVSLLGTWMGRGTEVWGPNSTLLQLIVSIQGLILVSEPFYNEAGYEKMVESQQGQENSRNYNELVILKLVQSMTEMLLHPPEVFKQEVITHFSKNGDKLVRRLQNWCDDNCTSKPEFSLLPVSRGLKLSLNTALSSFEDVLKDIQQETNANKQK
ncbi:(E3-independent) E2 ubiquitin-conjugating enzyme UBE2O [Agrilus planipennis]|uniref:(E3-independent) E2 ubiquitin-conjugating enzyme UBE2O n=1 Tax=Agrilus planipennis TaxID=224129 RepID=A0A1W4XLQ3_AGRPL|nr:(E3-independent) E2 ubiquitin-conjugating enzyme UBE2O [Agrilus planipennis]